MKIVCDSCGAKYSIADEKVAGKVFKIRCKRCSQVIVVKGNEGADAAPVAAASAAPGEGVWYIVVDGEQQGPMTAQAISDMLTAGRVDWEAYTWREGFDGWRPLREIQELVDEISPPGAPAPASAPLAAAGTPKPSPKPAAAKPAADPFAPVGGGGGGGGGLFGAPAAPEPSGGLFASPAAKSAPKPAAQARAGAGGGVDLFAAAQASAVPTAAAPEEDDVVSSTGGGGLGAAAAGGGAAGLTGQRNENSVLFSLSNLQALAGGPASHIVVIPSASVDDAGPPGMVTSLARRMKESLGVSAVTVLHTIDRANSDSDAFVEPLRKATGVWMLGGFPERLVQKYLGTKTERAIKELLDRGGVVGGESAGAMIQASWLDTTDSEFTPEVRTLIRTHSRGGFGLLTSAAIFPHFDKRGSADAVKESAMHPNQLAIGIDEATALVVRGDHAEVVGLGTVSFYNGAAPSGANAVVLRSGGKYDLAARRKQE